MFFGSGTSKRICSPELKMEAISLSTENELVRLYISHACINILKMIFVAYYTTYKRVAKSVFVTKEDYEGFSGDLEQEEIRKRLSIKDPEIKRIRSCHRNDLENIPAFLVVGFLYIITNPREDMVSLHFRIFTLSRIVHTVAYLVPLPQPSRFLGFLVGTLSIVSMAFQTFFSGKL